MTPSEDGLTREDVERVLAIIDRGGFDYVELVTDELSLTVIREGHGEAPTAGRSTSSPALSSSVVQPTDAASASQPVIQPAAPVAAQPDAAPPTPASGDSGPVVAYDHHEVVSPLAGICYLSPEPGADPYVSVGDRVDAGDTLALVEVMKMFAAVKSDVAGTVVAVRVKSNAAVALGQPLFVVDPS